MVFDLQNAFPVFDFSRVLFLRRCYCLGRSLYDKDGMQAKRGDLSDDITRSTTEKFAVDNVGCKGSLD
jgi:hypothetical protein